MKQLMQGIALLWVISMSGIFFACSSTPKGDPVRIGNMEKAAEATGEIYTIDSSASQVHFVGSGVGTSHPGSFRLSSGSLAVTNHRVTGGSFVININSLALDEQNRAVQERLHPHLLSADFFNVKRFPTAKFVITKVAPFQSSSTDSSIVKGANFSVSGNLTLKENTKNITFPANIELTNNTLRAKANLNIDRTQWNVNYKSEKSMKDKFISDLVNIQLDMQAKKQ